MTTPTPITITDATSNPDNNLFTVTFNTTHHITTTVTSDPTTITTWLSSLPTTTTTTPLLVGLDVEWRPNLHRNQDNPVATLQLCTSNGPGPGPGLDPTHHHPGPDPDPTHHHPSPAQPGPSSPSSEFSCLIFQILHSPKPLPKELIDFLSNDNVNFVGVGIRTDVEQLLVDYELKVKNVVELGELVGEKINGVKKGMGLKELSKVVMGFDVEKPKSVSLSRWDCEWLSYQQIQYACIDAFLSFMIGHKLMSL